jgi:hypothetical protein
VHILEHIPRVDHFFICLRDIQALDGGYGLAYISYDMWIIGAKNLVLSASKGIRAHEGGFKKTDRVIVESF